MNKNRQIVKIASCLLKGKGIFLDFKRLDPIEVNIFKWIQY